ncbi:MAG: SIS domain-containing protein [Thermoanaerobaculia bacterium]
MDIRQTFDETARVLTASAEHLPGRLQETVELFLGCLDAGGTILVCGNGGSAADAQHLAAELVCRVRRDRRAIPSLALTTDTSTLTAISNDYGFEQIFSRQIEALARKGDVLVAISTSGESANVIEAAKTARERGCRVVALTGEGGGGLAEHADLLLDVPATVVSRIQEIHAVCIHVLAESVEDSVVSRDQTGDSGVMR